MVATYRAAAKFIEKTHDLYPGMIYTNVSFVDSTALANELMLLGRRYTSGVVVTQVVPAIDSHASAILTYKTALAKYFPGAPPDYVSLEGYVAARALLILAESVGDSQIGIILIQHVSWNGGQLAWRELFLLICVSELWRQFRAAYRAGQWRCVSMSASRAW
jgi:hypothetical protein